MFNYDNLKNFRKTVQANSQRNTKNDKLFGDYHVRTIRLVDSWIDEMFEKDIVTNTIEERIKDFIVAHPYDSTYNIEIIFQLHIDLNYNGVLTIQIEDDKVGSMHMNYNDEHIDESLFEIYSRNTNMLNDYKMLFKKKLNSYFKKSKCKFKLSERDTKLFDHVPIYEVKVNMIVNM